MWRRGVGSGEVGVFALSAVVGFLVAPRAGAQAGTVQSEQKISETVGGFGGVLDTGDFFGSSVASLGDLDGDGTLDLAVGARVDDDGGVNQGAVWILFLDTDGTVKSEQKISETTGGFGGVLDNHDLFGSSVASLGDLDGDGIGDLAVGAIWDDDGDTNQGAVWILFLDTDGMVKSEQKISETIGGFGGVLDPGDDFGRSVASLGDLDGDGIGDLAVGARLDDDGDTNQGAVWILFLDTDGTVKSEQKISETIGGFGGVLDLGDGFGWSVASLGDLDGDGIGDLAVGAFQDDDGGSDQGAVWILFLDTDGTVKSQQKISETEGGFGGVLDPIDMFGSSLTPLGDLDGDGTLDLAVGAQRDDDGGTDQGAVWILFLDTDGTVKSQQKISETTGGFGGVLDSNDLFGISVARLGDLDGDGTLDLAVGAYLDDDGGTDQGAVWILFLEGDTVAPMITCPGNLTEECTGPAGAAVSFSVSATDDHDPDPDVMCVPASGSTFPMGPTTVTCTATDLSGNAAMCMFDVTVEDTTPPLITCPGDLTVYFGRFAPVGGGPATAVSFSVGASDLCDPAPSLVCIPPSGSVFDWGTTTVTCTAEDAEGNMSMCTFGVTVTPRPGGLSGPPGGVVLPGSAGPSGGLAGLGFEKVDRSVTDETRMEGPTPLLRLHRGATLRNGTGANPVLLVSSGKPLPGREWTALVDASAVPGARGSILFISDRPLPGAVIGDGELLVDVSAAHLLATSTVLSPLGTHAHRIRLEPRDALLGRRLHAQALVLGEGFTLTNAVDLDGGR